MRKLSLSILCFVIRNSNLKSKMILFLTVVEKASVCSNVNEELSRHDGNGAVANSTNDLAAKEIVKKSVFTYHTKQCKTRVFKFY